MTRVERILMERRRRKQLRIRCRNIIICLVVLLITIVVPITLYANAASNDAEDVITTDTTIETITETAEIIEEAPIVVVEPIRKCEADTTKVLFTTYEAEPEIVVHTLKINDININIDELMDIYYTDSTYGILNNNDDALINTCINFLLNQVGMAPEIVAGIIGNVCNEGHFGEEQNTYRLATSTEEYIALLKSTSDRGYGIAQWTHQSRQDSLAEHIDEIVNSVMNIYNVSYTDCVYGEYFPTVVVLSELTFLYKELLDYKLFEDFSSFYTVEDATGRIALSYERYKNCKKHWRYEQDGTCTLIGAATCSGAKRLLFAEQIYTRINDY